MIKNKTNKLLSILFSVLLIFSLLPASIGNAATLDKNIIESNIKDLDNIKVKNLITQSETTISKSQDTKNINGIRPITEGSSKEYIPEGLSIAKPPQSIVIGNDDRVQITNTTAFPYSAICYISILFPNDKTFIGTAWMYANNAAVTAGHCLYSAENGGWAKSIAVVPGMNGTSMPFGYTFAKAISAPQGWTENNSSDYDWGLIELQDNLGDKTGYFGAYWSVLPLNGNNVDVTGYPGEKGGTLWKMNGNITSSSLNRVNYSIDTTGGQSGCPVYWNDSQGYRAVAIHTLGSGSTNSGTRITKSMFDFMDKFRQ